MENEGKLHLRKPSTNDAAAIHSKITFFESLNVAETDHLGGIVARASAPEASSACAGHEEEVSDAAEEQPSKTCLSDEWDDIETAALRLAALEEELPEPPPCSCTSSCLGEEEEQEKETDAGDAQKEGTTARFVAYLKRKMEDLEKENNVETGDGGDDVLRKIWFFKNLLAAEMESNAGGDEAGELDGLEKRLLSMENGFAGRNRAGADYLGGDLSSLCSCNSSCSDIVEEKGGGEEETAANSTLEVCSLITQEVTEAKSEMAECKTSGGRRGLGPLRKLGVAGMAVGVFAVAGIVIKSVFIEGDPVYLVPT